ncbi:hypothetical protein BGZ60DRAFT_510724, partial [Tricladium varicosporioides]
MSTGEKFKLVWAILDQYREEGQFKGLKWSAIAENLGIDKPGTAQVRWHRLQKEFESGKLWDGSAIDTTPKKGKKAAVALNTITPKKAVKVMVETESEYEEVVSLTPEGKKFSLSKKTPMTKTGTKRKHEEAEEEGMGGPAKTPTKKGGRTTKIVEVGGFFESEVKNNEESEGESE